MEKIDTVDRWNELKELSSSSPVIIFKHSNTCPISARAHMEIERGLSEQLLDHVYKITVQDSQELKMKIAEDTGVTHESPQVIILKDGKSVYNASHHMVSSDILSSFIKIT